VIERVIDTLVCRDPIICLLASVVDRIMAPPCSPRKLPA
jgi:hypothetical protein